VSSELYSSLSSPVQVVSSVSSEVSPLSSPGQVVELASTPGKSIRPRSHLSADRTLKEHYSRFKQQRELFKPLYYVYGLKDEDYDLATVMNPIHSHIDIRAVIDSGCGRSVVGRRNLPFSYQRLIVTTPNVVTYRTASGTMISKCIATLPIKLETAKGKEFFWVRVRVVESSCPLLLHASLFTHFGFDAVTGKDSGYANPGTGHKFRVIYNPCPIIPYPFLSSYQLERVLNKLPVDPNNNNYTLELGSLAVKAAASFGMTDLGMLSTVTDQVFRARVSNTPTASTSDGPDPQESSSETDPKVQWTSKAKLDISTLQFYHTMFGHPSGERLFYTLKSRGIQVTQEECDFVRGACEACLLTTRSYPPPSQHKRPSEEKEEERPLASISYDLIWLKRFRMGPSHLKRSTYAFQVS